MIASSSSPDAAAPPQSHPCTVPMPDLVTNGLADQDAFGTWGVFLRPGDWLFGRGTVRVSTLLGSCVSLVLWAPRLQIGAMCHCVLPSRPTRRRDELLDGRFGEETGLWLDDHFSQARCGFDEVRASLAGGASGGDGAIGQANIAWAQRWTSRRGIRLVQQDVGGCVVRRLIFNLSDGSLTVAHGGRLAGARR
jgi:chemotaxis protein CheD